MLMATSPASLTGLKGRPPLRKVPGDFDVIFVEHGRLGCEAWYRARRTHAGPLKNARHEKFAQELAKGKGASSMRTRRRVTSRIAGRATRLSAKMFQGERRGIEVKGCRTDHRHGRGNHRNAF
jgi:hypothetical protein